MGKAAKRLGRAILASVSKTQTTFYAPENLLKMSVWFFFALFNIGRRVALATCCLMHVQIGPVLSRSSKYLFVSRVRPSSSRNLYNFLILSVRFMCHWREPIPLIVNTVSSSISCFGGNALLIKQKLIALHYWLVATSGCGNLSSKCTSRWKNARGELLYFSSDIGWFFFNKIFLWNCSLRIMITVVRMFLFLWL